MTSPPTDAIETAINRWCYGAPHIVVDAREQLSVLKADNERLGAALRKAREMVADWGSYASPYFQEKWDLAGDLAEINLEIQKAQETTI